MFLRSVAYAFLLLPLGRCPGCVSFTDYVVFREVKLPCSPICERMCEKAWPFFSHFFLSDELGHGPNPFWAQRSVLMIWKHRLPFSGVLLVSHDSCDGIFQPPNHKPGNSLPSIVLVCVIMKALFKATFNLGGSIHCVRGSLKTTIWVVLLRTTEFL